MQDVLRVGVASGCTERMFSNWKHILGSHHLRMPAKRQKKEMNIFVNDRVLCKSGRQFHAACESSTDSSNDDSEDEYPLSLLFK